MDKIVVLWTAAGLLSLLLIIAIGAIVGDQQRQRGDRREIGTMLVIGAVFASVPWNIALLVGFIAAWLTQP